MGLSSNQARFLSLTARQVDLEHRIQQVCQRRLRLSSELEKVATTYNNSISNRRMFTPPADKHERLNLSNLANYGYSVMKSENNMMLGDHYLPIYQLKDKDVKGTGATNAITSLDAGLKTVEYMDLKTGTMTTAIGIYSADALKALSSNQATAGVLSSNYMLMADVDLSSFNWTSLGNAATQFTGNFNANQHTISNLTINGTKNLGMFGTIGAAGVVQNVNLNGVNITAGAGACEIGAIAGMNNGKIDNVDASNININVTGAWGGSSNGAFSGGTNTIGGLVGGNNGNVDKVSTQGKMVLNTPTSLDGVGSLIGCNGSTSSLISNSYANLNILTNSNIGTNCVNTFVGCDAVAGNYSNCYSTGMIYKLDGVSIPASVGYQNQYFTGHNAGSNVANCWKLLSNGSTAYWNGSTTNWYTAAANSSLNKTGSNWSDSINGAPIWGTSGTTPVLNLSTINTYYYDGDNPSDEELETGLRNGTYYLAKAADEFTQNPIDFNGVDYEQYDWRATTQIYDELYASDDVDAENKYDKTVDEINSQDKKLQLEQTTIEVEYKAVASEKEAVKKILDTNATSSFKYFS